GCLGNWRPEPRRSRPEPARCRNQHPSQRFQAGGLRNPPARNEITARTTKIRARILNPSQARPATLKKPNSAATSAITRNRIAHRNMAESSSVGGCKREYLPRGTIRQRHGLSRKRSPLRMSANDVPAKRRSSLGKVHAEDKGARVIRRTTCPAPAARLALGNKKR